MANTGTRKRNATRYRNRLNNIFADNADKEQTDYLTKRAAFLMSCLDELENIIYEEGYVIQYNHGGGQKGSTVSPALKSYKMACGQLLDIMRQLKDSADNTEQKDELQEFLNKFDSKK